MALISGQVLQGRYRILQPLGQGGMGTVYLAEDLRLRSRCAIKERVADPTAAAQALVQMRAQFQLEARTLANLNHINLPRVTDFFSDGLNEYIVMEYVEGEDLASLQARYNGPLSEQYVLTWAEQVLDALDYLHSQPNPVIHRDIKPANIILTPDGRAKLVDFGLVKLFDPANPYTATAMKGMGTPEYTPLEQYGKGAGHTDARSDLYAFGATLYHLLTGVAPTDAPQRTLNPASLISPRQVNPALSASTEAAVLQAMALHPDQRFSSAQEMRAALQGSPAAPTVPVSSVARSRLPALFWGISAAVVLMIALLVWQLVRSAPPSTPTSTIAVADITEIALTVPPRLTKTATTTAVPAPSPTPTLTSTPQPAWTASPTVHLTLPDLRVYSVNYQMIGYEGDCVPEYRPLGLMICFVNEGDERAGRFSISVNGVVRAQVDGLIPDRVSCADAGPADDYGGQPQIVIDSQNEAAESNELNNVWSDILPQPTPPLLCTMTPAPPKVSPTFTAQVLSVKAFPISLESSANASLSDGYEQSPEGRVELGNVAFDIPGARTITTQAIPLADHPVRVSLPVEIHNPEKVYALVTAGNGFVAYNGSQVGMIWLQFNSGDAIAIPLILGQNIREWKLLDQATVSSTISPQTQEVWRTISKHGGTAIIDLLTIDIPAQYRTATLTGVVLVDTSVETVKSLDPAINLLGLTVMAADLD